MSRELGFRFSFHILVFTEAGTIRGFEKISN